MLKDIYEKEVIGSGSLTPKAPAGNEYIYLIFIASNDDEKVPFYVGKSTNPVSRFTRHDQVAWHNAVLREPAQVMVIASVPGGRVLEAEQELIDDLTRAGFILTNKDIRVTASRQGQADADMLNWTSERLQEWKNQAPAVKPVLDIWLAKWSNPARKGANTSSFQFWTPPAESKSLERDYGTARGAILPWALLGLMNPQESAIDVPMWSLMDDTGLYWREISDAVVALEGSGLWTVTNPDDGNLKFEYTPAPTATSSTRNAAHRHRNQRIDWRTFTAELSQLHREYTSRQSGTMPFTLEPRNPEIDPEGTRSTVLAFCLNDGTHIGHPYYFTDSDLKYGWNTSDNKAIAWHQKKFGTDPGIRAIYRVSQESKVTAFSFSDEAWAEGYYLLETYDDGSGLLVNAKGKVLTSTLEHFDYRESTLGLYDHRHLSSTATWESANTAVPMLAIPYSLNPYELHHVQSLREAQRLLDELVASRKDALLVRRYAGIPDPDVVTSLVAKDSPVPQQRPSMPLPGIREEVKYDDLEWDVSEWDDE